MYNECLKDILSKCDNHESIVNVKSQNFSQDTFHCSEVDDDDVMAIWKSLNFLDGTKSAVYDNIPASLVKTAAEELFQNITGIYHDSTYISLLAAIH